MRIPEDVLADFSDSSSLTGRPVTSEQLRQVLARLDTLIDFKSLKEDTPFRNAGADSFDFFTLILGIQEEYGITIPDEDIGKVRTLASLTQYLNVRFQ
jgi:acyl carrier protein